MRITDFLRRATWAAGAVATAKLVLGISVPLPSAAALTQYMEGSGTGLLRLYNFFGGGALARGSAFALGIMPYFSARMFMLLASAVSPTAKTFDAPRKKWWTRGLTVTLSLIQSYGYARFTESLPGAVADPGFIYTAEMILMLTSVSTLLMLFAEEAVGSDPVPLEVDDSRHRELGEGSARAHYRESEVRSPLRISHSTPVP